MKRQLSLYLCLLISGMTFADSKVEGLAPLADPYILLEDSVYYAYGTHSAEGIEVYTSKDLKSWEFRGLALHKTNTTEDRWFWAPEVYRKGDKYIMYYSANEHLYVATATSPLGPFIQQGGRLMQSVIGDEKCIDSSVFIDTDGTPWLFFVRFTDGNCIWQCRLGNDYMTPIASTLRECIHVTDPWESHMGRVCEGPFVVKRGDLYYLTYSANDFHSQDYAVGYATATTLDGLWTKATENPILHRWNDLPGCGHHSLFQNQKGELYIVFHSHFSLTEIYPRQMHIAKVFFSESRLIIGDDIIHDDID